jgi:hypothetical protein
LSFSKICEGTGTEPRVRQQPALPRLNVIMQYRAPDHNIFGNGETLNRQGLPVLNEELILAEAVSKRLHER